IHVRRGAQREGEPLDEHEAQRPPPHDVARPEHDVGQPAQIHHPTQPLRHARLRVSEWRAGAISCSGFVPRGQPHPANAIVESAKPTTYAHGVKMAPMNVTPMANAMRSGQCDSAGCSWRLSGSAASIV